MSWNGAGVFSRLYSWVARRDAGAPTHFIDATTMDAEFNNFKGGLENCLTRTGETAAAAAQPMAGFVHTGVGAATARTNYARAAEVQDGTIFKGASPGGTGDAMTGTVAPAPTAYAVGQIFTIIAPGANTLTNPTANFNAIGTKTIKKKQGALSIGDYASGDLLVMLYDGTALELLNPKYPAGIGDLSSLTTDSTGGAVADLMPFIDASESNASNKVTVQDFFNNILANITVDATGGATGDKLLISDASESNVANTVTVDNFINNVLQLLTTDNGNAGATGDLVPYVDASASNIGKKCTIASFFFGGLANFSEDTTPDANADFVFTNDASAVAPKKVLLKNLRVQEAFIIAVGDESTALTTGAAKVTFRLPYAFAVTAVRASLKTASSSGGPVTVDINEAGTTIISTKLTIDDNEKTSTTAAAAAVISDAAIADDAELTIDIDDEGSGAVGLKIIIIGYRTS